METPSCHRQFPFRPVLCTQAVSPHARFVPSATQTSIASRPAAMYPSMLCLEVLEAKLDLPGMRWRALSEPRRLRPPEFYTRRRGCPRITKGAG